MKGAPECMWISGFMHGVNNPKLTKRLNEHVPKTMEKMMTINTVFIRGEATVASKKKGNYHENHKTILSGRPMSENLTSEVNQGKDGGLVALLPLSKRPRKSFATEAGKFKPPPPMVTSVEKRSSNKFYEFHNDKGYSTDECLQLKKQIGELVRAENDKAKINPKLRLW
ncbi:hypothetical protein Tco_1165468 [Tanacetum coccineum]